ncbi:MAG: AI-2E family transporter [Acidimicrobiales bacterium]
MVNTSDRTQTLRRAALLTWTLVGIVGLLWAGLIVLDTIRLAVVPLVLALFPAALLSPLADRLKRRLPDAAAAAIVLVGFVTLLGGTLWLLGWLIAEEVPAMVDALEEAYTDVGTFLSNRFDITIPDLDEALERIEERAGESDVGEAGRTFAFTTLEVLSSFLLILVSMFFYLKDRGRMFRFLVELAPVPARGHVAEVGHRVWETLGGYFRGQLVVAAVDAVFIGLGLLVLGVPLALPLAVLVFFGGLFPIVGAFTAGALAVLVALADGGLPAALAVLVLNIAVQQLEGNLLQPVVVGRVTRLHPLVVLTSLTVGAVTLGVLGAFLAVPITASIARAAGYVLEQRRGTTPDEREREDEGAGAGAGAGDERGAVEPAV